MTAHYDGSSCYSREIVRLLSSIAQNRFIDALAMISIDLSADKMIDEFAEIKARWEKFKI